MTYLNPHITGYRISSPIYPEKNQGPFLYCSSEFGDPAVELGRFISWDFMIIADGKLPAFLKHPQIQRGTTWGGTIETIVASG